MPETDPVASPISPIIRPLIVWTSSKVLLDQVALDKLLTLLAEENEAKTSTNLGSSRLPLLSTPFSLSLSHLDEQISNLPEGSIQTSLPGNPKIKTLHAEPKQN